MEIPLSLPLDNDGFLRRECPHCIRQFKWHHGPANEEAENQPPANTYYCPLCGEPAGPESWWTREQLDYAQGIAVPAALREVSDELRRAFRGMSSKNVKFKAGRSIDTPEEPMPLTELDDMTMISSPCHRFEPVKVPEGDTGPFYCLVCGTPFAI